MLFPWLPLQGRQVNWMPDIKVAAVILSRMGSTRLFRKAVRPIAGLPMIAHVIMRAKEFPRVRESCGVVLAIPVGAENDELQEIGEHEKVKVVRGDEDDVLSRFLLAAHEVGAEVVYRVTGDNPLVDPGVISATWEVFLEGHWDYAVMEDTPLGTTAEIVTVEALERAQTLATTPALKEHPTLALYENRDKFRMRLVAPPDEWRHPEWRFTVDTDLDAWLVERLLYQLGEDAGIDDIVAYLQRHPEVARVNASVEQQGWKDLKDRKDEIARS
jgi:spore coat polysaccharide biosynthesis protein SpsF